MAFLLRVELPDVPGSLGRVAAAIGEAGGDIEAIEIVEKRPGGTAVDDVLLETVPGAMPDSLVSACNALEGVRVLWISRYAAGGGLVLDLEAVEDLTERPADALDRLIDLLPVTFRADWAARVRPGPEADDGSPSATAVQATPAAPEELPWTPLTRPGRVDIGDEVTIAVAAPLHDDLVVIGRRGGPEFLDSEIARLGHLVGLALSISRGA
jgi:hypothetical protein